MTILTEILLISFGVFLVAALFVRWNSRRTKIPGPWSWRFLGVWKQMGDRAYKYFYEQSKIYGPVFGCRIGGRNVIVLNDYQSIYETFVKQPKIFGDRIGLRLQKWDESKKGPAPGGFLLREMDQTWKDLRTFSLHALIKNDLGVLNYDKMVTEAISEVIEKLHRYSLDKQPFSIGLLFASSIRNIMSKLLFGQKYDLDDKSQERFAEDVDVLTNGFDPTGPFAFFPRFLIIFSLILPFVRKKLRRFMSAKKNIFDNVLPETIKYHEETFNEEYLRDFCDVFILERRRRVASGENEHLSSFNNVSLVGVLLNLLLGGIDTTVTTLSSAVLYLLQYPDIQDKLQRELDAIVGRARMPTSRDKPMLNYMKAFILEVHRCACIFPLGIFRQVSQDTTYRGYELSKGTCVIANLWAVHHDPDYFSEPEVFKPERFLDANGIFVKNERVIAFSIGRRSCPGETLAQRKIYHFLTHILHSFSFRPETENAPPPTEKKFSASLRPHPFKVRVEERLLDTENSLLNSTVWKRCCNNNEKL